jgi:hypothetical protein
MGQAIPAHRRSSPEADRSTPAMSTPVRLARGIRDCGEDIPTPIGEPGNKAYASHRVNSSRHHAGMFDGTKCASHGVRQFGSAFDHASAVHMRLTSTIGISAMFLDWVLSANKNHHEYSTKRISLFEAAIKNLENR